jgi:hypothetical protein
LEGKKMKTQESFFDFAAQVDLTKHIRGLYAQRPAYRRFVKEVRQGGIIPDHLEEYFGYGLFVGRK